ncbi:MAG TPA: hypothetical protein VFM61_06540, partial [Pseudidiomarina sp.]|nr:hypothetical protein [Pseudidiomarina sp.]
MAAMAKAQQQPAYIERLKDYDIQVRSGIPEDFGSDTKTIWWIQEERLSPALEIAITQAIESDMRVFLVGLTTDKAPVDGFSIESMQVPFYTAHVDMKPQQLAQLSDIMPTVVGYYMNCADDARTWSLGQNLAKSATEWPMIASFGSQLVIYTESERIVIDQDASTRMYQGNQEMPNSVPPTPILINALRDVKRFSATGE